MQKNLVSTIDTKSNVIVLNIEQRELLQLFVIIFDKLDTYKFFVYVFFLSKKHVGE